jgi:hypothetical protein
VLSTKFTIDLSRYLLITLVAMDDPLSVTASVIAVFQLSGTIITYLCDAKGIQKECRKLLPDIEYTQGTLELLKDTVQDVQQSGTWAETMKIRASNSSPIQTLKDVLEPLRTKLEKKASTRSVSRLAQIPRAKICNRY